MSKQPKNPPKVSAPTKKPAVVLIHGYRGAPVGLGAIAEALRQSEYSVYTPAIPPFAGAEKLTNYTPNNYASFLAQYIRQQELDHPILVGHSMGSIIVAATIDKYPEILNKKAILLSPISKRTAPPFRLIAPFSAILPTGVIDYITTKYLFIPKDKQLFHQVLEITRQCSHTHPPHRKDLFGATNLSTHYAVTDFSPHTKQLLLIAGEQDRLVHRKQTIKLAKSFNAAVEFLPNCGHLHNYEQPQATAQLIIDFLEKKK